MFIFGVSPIPYFSSSMISMIEFLESPRCGFSRMSSQASSCSGKPAGLAIHRGWWRCIRESHVATWRVCCHGWMMVEWWLNDGWMMVEWWLNDGWMMVEWWLNSILYLLSPKIQWKKPMFYLHLFAWNDYNDSPTRLDVLLILPFVGPCEKHTVHQFYPWDPLSAYFTGSISKSKHIETKGPNPRFSAEYGPSGFTTWKSPFVSPGIWQMMIRSSASNGMNVMLESGSTNTIWILCKKSRSTNHWRRWLMYEEVWAWFDNRESIEMSMTCHYLSNI